MPHTHAGMSDAEKCEHDQTAHIHTRSHGHHHHHGQDAQNERDATPENSSKAPSEDASDDGALSYFQDTICFEIQSEAFCKTNQVEEIQAKTFSVAVIDWLEANLAPMTVIQPSPLWQPPDAVLDESTIYLTLRNLRI